jgi:hypothetical protein
MEAIKLGKREPEEEKGHYRDTGCDLYPISCLTCPFPVCRYDVSNSHGKQTIIAEETRLRVRQIAAQSPWLTRREVATMLGISTRQVYRALKE